MGSAVLLGNIPAFHTPHFSERASRVRIWGQREQRADLLSACPLCPGLVQFLPRPQVKQSRSVVSDSLRPHGLQPTRLPHPWNSPGKSTGVGCHVLLQGPRRELLLLVPDEKKWELCQAGPPEAIC